MRKEILLEDIDLTRIDLVHHLLSNATCNTYYLVAAISLSIVVDLSVIMEKTESSPIIYVIRYRNHGQKDNATIKEDRLDKALAIYNRLLLQRS